MDVIVVEIMFKLIIKDDKINFYIRKIVVVIEKIQYNEEERRFSFLLLFSINYRKFGLNLNLFIIYGFVDIDLGVFSFFFKVL